MRAGQPVELRWTAAGPSHRVEILALESDEVLLARDVGAPPLRAGDPLARDLPLAGLARDARGLESPPSAEGLICSVDK